MNEKIITKPYSSSYASGWESCFLKKPQDWLDILHPEVIVKSPDGFRWNDGVTWETPMRKEEFERRIVFCTLLNVNLFINPKEK